MDTKVWRASGSYMKSKRKFYFTREILAPKDSHVREKILSELGSRHRVRRCDITFSDIKEIKPEDLTNLDLRRFLGLESDL